MEISSKIEGLTKLTETTGTVKGRKQVANFIVMLSRCCNGVEIVGLTPNEDNNYLQYTLLNDNKIRVYISTIISAII